LETRQIIIVIIIIMETEAALLDHSGVRMFLWRQWRRISMKKQYYCYYHYHYYYYYYYYFFYFGF